MQPRGELSSTGYALASPGREYLILQPGETLYTVGGKFEIESTPGHGTRLIAEIPVESKEEQVDDSRHAG